MEIPRISGCFDELDALSSHTKLHTQPQLLTPQTRFAHFCCVWSTRVYQVQIGPRTGGTFDDGYWGRHMVLPSQELFQMRFSPKDLVSTPGHRIVFFATRTTSITGQCHVSSAVLFRPESVAEQGFTPEPTAGSIVGCKGLHILMAAFFKRHNPGVSGRDRTSLHPTNGMACDHAGYQAVRSTTYSVHKADRKNLERSSDHAGACSATSGSSILTIAGEVNDMHITPMVTRAATPISQKKWAQDCANFRQEILSDTPGTTAGNAAILSAASIVELLSAEGFIAMAANPFFSGARPDNFFLPSGIPLVIAMAVRMAMHWDHYGLPRPSRADLAANDQLRMLFETTTHAPLTLMEQGNHWAIDVVVRASIKAAEAGLAEYRVPSKSVPLYVLEDQKVFYQRVGQRLITSTFGLGSSCGVQSKNQYGHAWRMEDGLEIARLRYLADPRRGNCCAEGMDQSTVAISSIGKRRTELVQTMRAVEEWLRTGMFKSTLISPPNTNVPAAEQVERIKTIVGTLMLPSVVGDIVRRVGAMPPDGPDGGGEADTIEDVLAKTLLTQVNVGALAVGIGELQEYLIAGPVTHFKHRCGAYIVAPTQSNACCDCETPVHVLQGTMLANRYGECTGCHARRCLHCADTYAKAVQVTEPQSVGKRCRACGADPAWVDVVKSVDRNTGLETFSVHLCERVPWRQGAAIEPVERSIGGGASSSASSKSDSTNRKKLPKK